MNNDQFMELIKIFEKISNKSFTITSAADWPIVAILGGTIAALVVFMWKDLRTTVTDSIKELSTELKEHKNEFNTKIKELKTENDKEHDALRSEICKLKEKCTCDLNNEHRS